jgi:dihydrofolate synthase / folylpolyglutamate synthase
VRLSTTLAAQQNSKIYVAGGLFLAIEYAVVAGGGRAQDLDFF